MSPETNGPDVKALRRILYALFLSAALCFAICLTLIVRTNAPHQTVHITNPARCACGGHASATNRADFMNQDRDLRSPGPPPVFPDDSPVLLTIPEAARELRCSKTYVHNLIYGKVPDVPPLPVLHIGGRILIRHDGLKAWMLAVERARWRREGSPDYSAKAPGDAMIRSTELIAAGARKE